MVTKVHHILSLSLLSLTLGGLSLPSLAAESPFQQRMLDRMDINDDGIVSIEEFQPPMEVRLSRADADNDGAVTLEELNQHRADREAQHVERQANHADQMTQRFLAMDIDGSGGVTPDEARLAAFHHMDSDQNGSLSVDELRRPEERKGKGGKGKHRNL